jgi:hypothetical protein
MRHREGGPLLSRSNVYERKKLVKKKRIYGPFIKLGNQDRMPMSRRQTKELI